MCNGCHGAMDVTKQWMSQSNGCHKAMAVTEQWESQSSGCHKAMAVTEQWMSQRFGGKSRTKPSFSHLPLSLFEGSLARNAFLRE